MPKMAMMSLMSAGVLSLATASYILGRYGWPKTSRSRRGGKSARDTSSSHCPDGSRTTSWFARFGWFGKADKNDRLPSGNLAFEEYRADTLMRLEEEQAEFSEFLAKLRRINDAKKLEDFRRRR